ncbi:MULTISPECIES: PTS sugar transporter subunit IIA [unclassified Pseudodesulfovibrio]|uniref:PTS sugar transporter subunit IIA n=1 Tax=unclassified Pseudodesulfovibrio TaxID=2661612 RepID=UPI000FEC073D|nr:MULTISPECIES: PTS sugar transporter subunit IIA [unclassified Pseudodesulfovibrio]MCJ2163915.1 PTS sugar transporter subunit IIA [Pseudodesulfovibrio sp. S3-i]RWU05840.1 PTS sugar transporter subunit IIA [Pseudodesulfovibrio sp. S3]
MKLGEYLAKELILPDLVSVTKSDVLKELIVPLGDKYPEMDTDQAVRVLLEREKLGTTGIGDGIAIPHGKLDDLDKVVVVVGRSQKGVEFEALDHNPCTFIFLVLAPEQVAGMHLRVLAQISRLLKDEEFRKAFQAADNLEALWGLLKGV